jgi:hypothetical protein
MAALAALPTDYDITRDHLQLVAIKVLARARFLVTGRFGLRATWDGFATPAFGPATEILRISGDLLIHERQDDQSARTRVCSMPGRSLEELAAFGDVDLTAPFSAGKDAPAVGDASAPIELSAEAVAELQTWFRLGATSLDRVLPRLEEPTIMQLWPEHFDVGFDAATAAGRVNLGASPGDGAVPEPYLYIGPWDEARPGAPAFWNVPFGAVLTHSDLRAAADPLRAAVSFLNNGLDLLG